MNELILTDAQAKEIYAAMCALNNVAARIEVTRDCDDNIHELHVKEYGPGFIEIWHRSGETMCVAGKVERYDSQAAFATAYGV